MPQPAEPAARTRLLVVQSTPFCNIDCGYCYLPHRSSTRRLTPETARALFPRLLRLPTFGREVSLVWHAGEPMVLPVPYYRDLFDVIDAATPDGLAVHQSFQTNATLVTPAWCDFIAERRIQMGVSLDGPRALHDRHRRRRDGTGSFDTTLAGLRLLQAHGIPFHVISVLTGESLLEPDAMFAFFREIDVSYVCFNIEEQEGTHARSGLVAEPATLARYRAFLRRFTELNLAAGYPIGVREIEDAFAAVRGHSAAPAPESGNEEARAFAIVSVDCEGNVSTFSPELLSQTHPRYGGFVFGNLLQDDFAAIAARVDASPLAQDIAAGVESCRAACAYFGLCGGGTPSNKIYENGTAASTETLYCRVHRANIDLALELTERLPADLPAAWAASRTAPLAMARSPRAERETT